MGKGWNGLNSAAGRKKKDLKVEADSHFWTGTIQYKIRPGHLVVQKDTKSVLKILLLSQMERWLRG
jgi:phage host-nuclease inhibitor protein Gam